MSLKYFDHLNRLTRSRLQYSIGSCYQEFPHKNIAFFMFSIFQLLIAKETPRAIIASIREAH